MFFSVFCICYIQKIYTYLCKYRHNIYKHNEITTGSMLCILTLIFSILSFVLAGLLLIHHYFKHVDLAGRGFYRIFQPEDVFVFCFFERPIMQRCSHEVYVVILVVCALVLTFVRVTHECPVLL